MRLILPLLVLFTAACSTGGGPDGSCDEDIDCGTQKCVGGRCLECGATADCDDGDFCCQGVCRAGDEVQDRCGCAPSTSGPAGEDCGDVREDALCLVGDDVATFATVATGTCGCGCSVDEGGPICGAPETEGGAPVCTCAGNADCAGGALDDDGRPHQVANTCLPNATCSCVTAGGSVSPCDVAGATPDCSFESGCRALLDDVLHCGVGGRSCLDGATGVADAGACFSGGCQCDNAGDCQGALNVNTCAFPVVDEPSRCVCSGYTKGGVQIACPMELECVADGCVYLSTVYGSEEALLAELSLGPAVP